MVKIPPIRPRVPRRSPTTKKRLMLARIHAQLLGIARLSANDTLEGSRNTMALQGLGIVARVKLSCGIGACQTGIGLWRNRFLFVLANKNMRGHPLDIFPVLACCIRYRPRIDLASRSELATCPRIAPTGLRPFSVPTYPLASPLSCLSSILPFTTLIRGKRSEPTGELIRAGCASLPCLPHHWRSFAPFRLSP